MVVLDTMDMLDSVTMDMLGSVTMAMLDILAMVTTMESVRLRLSQRLRLTQPYFTAPMAMVLVTMAMLDWVITDMLVSDILDTLPTMASVQHDLVRTIPAHSKLSIQSVTSSSVSLWYFAEKAGN